MLRIASLVLLVIGLAGGFSLPLETGRVLAQEKNEKKYKTRRTPTISEQVYKRLAEAQALIDEEDLPSAEALLWRILERDRANNSYERASIYNMLAYISYAAENYSGAVEHYEEVIAERLGIPQGLELATLYTLSQLHFLQEEYLASLDYLEEWFQLSPDPGPNPYVFLAQIHYQNRNFDQAIPAVETAIELAIEQEMTVRENWWLLLRSMYFEREEYAKVIEILEIMVRDFPKREYWVQLSGMYGQEGFEDRQIQAIDAAYIDDLLKKEREIMNIAGLLLQNDVPYRAGVIIEKGMADGLIEPTVKNMKTLAQAWQLAQEADKAAPVLEEAASKDKTGDLYLYLAQVYLDQDKYEGCINAASTALRKGGLKRGGLLAHEVQGICRFNSDLLEQAGESFRAAKQISQDQRDLPASRRISQWIRYIEQEQQRLIALGLEQS